MTNLNNEEKKKFWIVLPSECLYSTSFILCFWGVDVSQRGMIEFNIGAVEGISTKANLSDISKFLNKTDI